MKKALLTAILVAVIAAATLCIVPYQSIHFAIDPVTGSERRDVIWLNFIRIEPVIETSALELWMNEQDVEHIANWKFYSSTDHYLYWSRFGCGTTPPVFKICGGPLEVLVRHSSDAELTQLVATLKTGDRLKQESAVESACQRLNNIFDRRGTRALQ